MKRETIFLGSAVIVFLLLVSCLFPTDQSLDRETGTDTSEAALSQSEAADSSAADLSVEDKSSTEVWLCAGTYTVGDSLPAGGYVLRQLPDAAVGYVRAAKGKKSLLEQNFEGCFFISLESGQSLSFSGASLAPAEGFQMKVDLQRLAPGMYRVGVDIPAGTYEMTEDEDQPLSSYAIYQSDSAKRTEREKRYVMSAAAVEVRNGELLELIGCTAQRQGGMES